MTHASGHRSAALRADWLAQWGAPPQHEGAAARKLHRRVRWLAPAALLISIPAFYLELLGARWTFPLGEQSTLQLRAGWCLYLLAAAMLSFYLAAMWRASERRAGFLARNACDALIGAGLAASLLGSPGPWQSAEWVPRMMLVALIALRLLGFLRGLIAPRGTLYVLGISAIGLALAGAGFYWLEPTVNSYAEGLWLAFESGATVGYGDIVPTTPAARVFAVFMVLLGYALLSLVTASIAAFFIGEDEKRLRQEFHHDIKQLRDEVRALRREIQQRQAGDESRGAAT